MFKLSEIVGSEVPMQIAKFKAQIQAYDYNFLSQLTKFKSYQDSSSNQQHPNPEFLI